MPLAAPIVNEAPAPVIPMAADVDIEVVSVSAAADVFAALDAEDDEDPEA